MDSLVNGLVVDVDVLRVTVLAVVDLTGALRSVKVVWRSVSAAARDLVRSLRSRIWRKF